MDGFADASSPWLTIFWIGCYVSTLACLAFAVRHGLRRGWWAGFWQVALLTSLVVFYFCLESFGEVRIPFYIYAPGFPDDWLPPIPLETLFPSLSPKFGAPIAACRSLVKAHEPATLPLSIPLMEATLTYASLWTAHLLGARLILQPIVAGCAMLFADSVIDPILTTSFDCPAATDDPATHVSGSFGLWKWHGVPYAPHGDALGPDWFGIPLINYVIWFAGPVMLIGMVLALSHVWQSVREAWKTRTFPRLPRPHWPTRSELLRGLTVVICGAATLIVFLSPALAEQSTIVQRMVFYAAVLAAFGYMVESVTESEQDAGVEVGIVFPQLFFLLFSAAYLLGTGLFRQQPEALLTAAVFVPLGMFFCWSPYGGAIDAYRKTLSRLDGYLRLRYLSYSSLMVFLGAASVVEAPPTPILVGLLLVALGFNTHSFLVNDVVDLTVDRTQPRRQNDPQVRGDITPEASITIALALVPLLFLLTWRLGGGVGAHAALIAAFVFMAIYNAWGKQFPFPPVTDLIQGMAWGSLAIYGAELAGHTSTPMTWLVAAYGTGFMFLINGVHGGLRDLDNDLLHRQYTTAIHFGAESDGNGGAVSTFRLRLFAGAVHGALMLVLVMLLVHVGWGKGDRLVWLTVPATIAAAVASFAVNRKVVAESTHGRDFYVSVHLLVALLPLVFVAMPALSNLMRVVVVVTFFGALMFVQPLLILVDEFDLRPAWKKPREKRPAGERPEPRAPDLRDGSTG